LQQKLDELEIRKAVLQRELGDAQPTAPRLNPNLAKIYRAKVERLREALAEPAEREEALEILRGLIERVDVRPSPNDRSFEVELMARSRIWSLSSPAQKAPGRSRTGVR
jgi:site-specific DNA recombinase